MISGITINIVIMSDFDGELVAGEVRQLPDQAAEHLHRTGGDDDH